MLDVNYPMQIYYKSNEKYHWLDIVGTSEDPHYIFCNSDNELQKFIIRFDAFLNKKLTLQNYTELIQTNNQLDNCDLITCSDHLIFYEGEEFMPKDFCKKGIKGEINLPNKIPQFSNVFTEHSINLQVHLSLSEYISLNV